MYKCEICGRESFKKIRYGGYILCSKHMHQLHDYGKFLDTNPRTCKDLNHFTIIDDYVVFDLYDQRQNKVGEFFIDLEDLEKVRYYRWRQSYGHIVTGNSTQSTPTLFLSRLLMNCYDPFRVVDHRDGNPYNNRKYNLRICTQGENTLNKSYMSRNTTGFIGISPDNRQERKNKYCAEIRYQGKRFRIGQYQLLEEAVYARWIAELILFGQYRNTNNDIEKFKLFDMIPQGRKIEISTYISNKINSKLSV